MSDLPPLTAKVAIDSTDFKSGIAEMNRSLRILESGFRASAAELGDWGQSASGLELRIKSLNGQIDIQAKKVGALQKEYERVAKEKGETSKAAQDLQIRLNKETETLGKMKSELGKTEIALNEMGDEAKQAGKDVKNLGDQENEAGKKTVSLTDKIGGLKTVVLALVAAAVEAAKAIGKLVISAADYAGELVNLSLKTGIGVEQLQELSFVADQVGTDLDTITSSLARLIRAMRNASESGTSPAAKAFQELGISVTDSNGQLRNSQDVFNEVIDRLGKMTNETQRDALAMEIFGRSAMELNPLIKAGSDEIERLTQKAHEMGAVVNEDTVNALEAWGDELEALKGGLQGTKTVLAADFLPELRSFTGTIKDLLAVFNDLPKGIKVFLVGMYGLGSFLVKIGPTLIGIKLLFGGLGGAAAAAGTASAGAAGDVGILGTALGVIFSPIGLLIALIGLLALTIKLFGADAVKQFKGLVELWWLILTGGFKRIFDAFKQWLKNWIAAIKALPSAMRTLWQAVGKAIVDGVWKGIQDNYAWFKQKVKEFFQGIIDSVLTALGIGSPLKVFAEIGQQMALGLGLGFTRSFKGIRDDIVGAVNGIKFNLGPVGMEGVGLGGRGVNAVDPYRGAIAVNFSQVVNLSGGPGMDESRLLRQMKEVTEQGITEAVRKMRKAKGDRW